MCHLCGVSANNPHMTIAILVYSTSTFDTITNVHFGANTKHSKTLESNQITSLNIFLFANGRTLSLQINSNNRPGRFLAVYVFAPSGEIEDLSKMLLRGDISF